MGQKKNRKRNNFITLMGLGLACVIIVFLILRADSPAESEQALLVSDESVATEGISMEDAEKIEISLVQVQVEDASNNMCKNAGTGVVYHVSDTGIWIATATHVLEEKREADVIIVTAAGEMVQCHKWSEASDSDLTFLFLEYEAMAQESKPVFVPIKTDKASYDVMTEDTPITAVGYSDGELVECRGRLTNAWIYVEDFAQYMILAECEVYPGMSGGGMYDDASNCIGMICGGNEEGELVAVPWHVMQARFEEIVN